MAQDGVRRVEAWREAAERSEPPTHLLVGGEARVNDDESLEVGWFAPEALPELDEYNRERITLALDGSGTEGTVFRFGGVPSETG